MKPHIYLRREPHIEPLLKPAPIPDWAVVGFSVLAFCGSVTLSWLFFRWVAHLDESAIRHAVIACVDAFLALWPLTLGGIPLYAACVIWRKRKRVWGRV